MLSPEKQNGIMGRIFPALLLCLFVVVPGRAGTTLTFPKVSFAGDLLTGIAIANPTARNATVTLTAYGEDGIPVVRSGFKNPVELTVPAGQQLARVVSEVFGSGLEPGTSVWIQGTCSEDGLTAFSLLFNASGSLLDGSEAPAKAQKLVFNHVKVDGGYSTELNIVNPAIKDAHLQVQLISPSGVLQLKELQIPAHGLARLDVASYFADSDLDPAVYVALDSDEEIVGYELIRSTEGDAYGLNARPSAEKLSSLYFQQLSVLGNSRTGIGVVNYSSNPVILTFSAIKSDGTVFDSRDIRNNPVTRSLRANESLYEDVAVLFGFHGDKEVEGSITVRATADAINGYVTYGSGISGAAAAVVSSAEGRKRAIFSHVATGSEFYTGLTLFNPGTLPANIRVMVIKTGGQAVGTYDGVIQPGGRLSRRLGSTDFIPQAGEQVGGFLWVRSDLPVYMSSFIGTSRASTNIQPQVSPESFNPDSAVASLKMKPAMAIVPPGSSQRFQVEGAKSSPVWKVNGSPGGSAATGTINGQGVFLAPKAIPERQVVTITADVDTQSAGASADVIAKGSFISDLRLVKSVAYLESLSKIYAAELVSLGTGAPKPLAEEKAPPNNSYIFEVSQSAPQKSVATFEGETIAKIIPMKVTESKEYLLLLGQTGGRVIRLDPSDNTWRVVVSGLDSPASMVFDPVTGDLLVAEREKVSTISRDLLLDGLAQADPVDAAFTALTGRLQRLFASTAAAGLAIDQCTGKIYYSLPAEGAIAEYDPVTGAQARIVTGLSDPGQLLGLYRQGITCPDSFHLLVVEKGTNKVLLVLPQTRNVTEWVAVEGVEDIAFVPSRNLQESHEAVLVAGFTSETQGTIFLVALNSLYDIRPPNPPESSLVSAKANLAIRQSHLPYIARTYEAVEYSVTVTNKGPSDATGVVILDQPPARGGMVTATPSQGACTLLDGNFRCSIGELRVGEEISVSIRIDARYFTGQGTYVLENSASVTCTEVDPDPTDNSSTDEVAVLPSQTSSFDVQPNPASFTAGGVTSVTITARDERGNVSTTYAGAIVLGSTDPEAVLPGSYTFTPADQGVHTFTDQISLRTAGNQTISVTDISNRSMTGSGICTVAAAPAKAFGFTSIPSSFVAGAPYSITVNARDGFGNVDPAFRGTVHFSSSDPQAELPPDYTFTAFDAGSHVFPIILKTAGTQTVTVTTVSSAAPRSMNGSAAGGTVLGTFTVTVGPGEVSSFKLAGLPANLQAGTIGSMTITARDAFGNIVVGYRGSIRFTSADSAAVLPAPYTFSAADAGNHTFTDGITFKTAGAQSLTIADASNTAIQVVWNIRITPAPATGFTVTSATNSIMAGVPVNLVVTARDSYGNTDVNYAGTIRFGSNDPHAVLPANYIFSAADAGVHAFQDGVTLKTAGLRSVTATDSTTESISGTMTVTVTPAAEFSLSATGLPATLRAGTAVTLVVMIQDAFGNAVVGHRGTIAFTTSDSAAIVPAIYSFSATDAGTHTFAGEITFKTAGAQNLTIASTSNGLLQATLNVGITPAPATSFLVTGMANIITAGEPANLVVTAKDSFGNTDINYAGTVRFASNDPQAILPGVFTFNAAAAGVQRFPSGVTLKTAGPRRVTATDTVTAAINGFQNVTVDPGPASGFSLALSDVAFEAGTTGSLTVTVRDTYGNIVVGYRGTITIQSSDPSASVPTTYTFTAADAGVHTFVGISFRTAGAQTLIITDTSNPTIQTAGRIGVTPARLVGFELSLAAVPMTAGVPANLVVTAKDSYGNTDINYSGTIRFTSSDTQAALPADYTFSPADAGVHTFRGGITLKTAGWRTIGVADVVTASVNGSQSVTVNPGPAAILIPTGLAAASEAGTTNILTVTLRDAFGNVAAGYRGSIGFQTTDPVATLPGVYTFSASDAGVHTYFGGLVFRTAGAQNLTIADISNTALQVALSIRVNPASAAGLVVSGVTNPIIAGVPANPIVTAKDPYGNTDVNYAGTIRFASNDGQAVLPVNYTFGPADYGVHRFQGGVTLKTAGQRTVIVTDLAKANVTGSQTVTVDPATASSFSLTGLPANLQAGTAGTLTVTARDAFGNIAVGYRGSISLTSSDPAATLPTTYTFSAADSGIHTFSGAITFKTAGAQTLAVKDALNAALQAFVNIGITPAPATGLTVTGLSNPYTAGAQSNLVVTAKDSYGNTDVNYAGTVHFTSNDGQAVLPANYTFGPADAGVHSFQGGVTLKTTGQRTVTVTDIAKANVNGSQTVLVDPATAASFGLTGLPANPQAGAAVTLTVTVNDAYGNVAAGYRGSITITSSDPAASLPANYTFSGADSGIHTFTGGITFRTAGAQTLTATDTLNAALKATGNVGVIPASASGLVVTGLSNPSTAGVPSSIVVTAKDPYGNTDVNYSGTVRFTSNDGQAVLPANYAFTPVAAGVHTFASGVTLKTAGSRTVTVTDTVNAAVNGSQTVTVTAASAASIQMTGLPGSMTAGTSSTVVLTTRDAYSNIATGYSGTIAFTSSDGQAVLPANYTFVPADAGVHSFSGGVILKTSGSQSVTATDISVPALSASQTSTIQAAAAAGIQIVGFPAALEAGQNSSLVVTAYDAFSNVATGYLGSVTITSSDPKACIPGGMTQSFTSGNAGSRQFGALTLGSVGSGTQTVTASDGTLADTANVSMSPNTSVPIVVTASSTPSVPADLKITCVSGPNSITNIPCPVLQWGGYTYWAFSYLSNSFGMAIVAYDCAGNQIQRWDMTPARYLWQITVDANAQTVTFWGQASDTITMSWSSLAIP